MNYSQYLLIKLAEEASEIAQVALKTAQFGLDEIYPNLTETNAERIYSELNDLAAIVIMLNNDEAPFNFSLDFTKMAAKQEKVSKYLQYSVDLGHVTLF